jgi:putative hemolysin
VNAEFALNLDDANYDTIGGFVMGRLGRIPKLGDEVVVEAEDTPLLFKVEEMDKLRVAKVRLVRKK